MNIDQDPRVFPTNRGTLAAPKTNNREKDKKSNCDNYRISISCRSAADNRNKVKGKSVSGDVIKGPRGRIRATRTIGYGREVTCKSTANASDANNPDSWTNAMTLDRRMGPVTVQQRMRDIHTAGDIWQITF